MIIRPYAPALLAWVWPALVGQALSTPANTSLSRMQETGFVSGSVHFEDGTPPPESIVVKRVCGRVTRNEVWTDRKGRFSFQLGGPGQSMAGDASVGSGRAPLPGVPQVQMNLPGVPNNDMSSADSLVGCDLHAELTGYRSDVIHLDRIGLLEKGQVGAILLHRLGNVEGLTVSATTIAAPKEAAKAYQEGVKEASRQHPEKARQAFSKAVAAYPNYASAWTGLGLVCEQLRDTAAAEHAYAEASRADAKLLTPWERLTVLADGQEHWPDSARYSDQWIHLDPVDYPNAYLLNAVAYVRLNKLEQAEKSAREGLRLDKDGHFPRIRYVLGYILAAGNQFTEALAFFHDYLTMSPNGSDAPVLRAQLPALEQAAASARKR